jgi:hypothetical protein
LLLQAAAFRLAAEAGAGNSESRVRGRAERAREGTDREGKGGGAEGEERGRSRSSRSRGTRFGREGGRRGEGRRDIARDGGCNGGILSYGIRGSVKSV